MTHIYRVRVSWGGPTVLGGGVSTHFLQTISSSTPLNLSTFYIAMAAHLAAGTTIDVPNSGDVIEDSDGSLAGSWSMGTKPALITATGNANYAAGVGYQVRWRTAGIVARRRVVGSTFMVPMESISYDTAGTILNTVVTGAQSAVNALLTAEPTLCVWSRPVPSPTPPATTPVARAGASSVITSGLVPDRVSWLRSRRT